MCLFVGLFSLYKDFRVKCAQDVFSPTKKECSPTKHLK